MKGLERWRLNVIRIVGAYLVAGVLWILLSDVLLWQFLPQTEWRGMSTLKGLFFVAATSTLLAILLWRAFSAIDRSQRDLQLTQRRFALFMDNLPVAAFVKEPDGRYIYLNPYFRRRFLPEGRQVEESTSALFSPALVQKFAESDRIVLETRDVHESEILIEEGGGITGHWLTRRFPVPRGDGGDSLLIGGFAVDITERHRLEEQLRQAGKMEALGRVAGGIAHDFNNMLTVINGYASLLARELAGTPGERKALEIATVGDRAASLTQQLLAFSRKQQHHPERLDLNHAIREMEPVIVPLLGPQIQIVHALDPSLPPILADLSQVQQILLNLATNARDAMPDGGILSFETRRPGPDGFVHLAVRDNGIGMDAPTRERIFEPFFTTKDPGKGLGLGLATVYGAVRQNGGAISVDSAPGRGAAFTILLPPAP